MTLATPVHHGSTAWRILVELAGRAAPITEQDLCETLGFEPTATHRVLRDLWLDNRIDHPMLRGSEVWQITWQGQDLLRRIDEAHAVEAAKLRSRFHVPAWWWPFLCGLLLGAVIATGAWKA